MGLLDDIMKTLDRVPGWKRINALPAEVDALRKRLDALEAKMQGGSGQACPICGSAEFARESTDDALADIGYITDHFRCRACGHSEKRQRDVLQR